MNPRPVVIDTDTGVDDALALLLAMRSPEIRIVGITTVAGNVEVHRCTRNVRELIRRFGRRESVTVVSGAPRPLRLPLVTASEVHGPGGMGNVTPLRAPAMSNDPLEAPRFIASQARRYGRHLTIVAIGPLTNVAIAFRKYPREMRSVGRIISMGGAFHVPGNTGPVSEFNYYVDPHAVQVVLANAARLLILPLDVTEQITLMWSEVVRRPRGKAGRWMRQLVDGYMRYHLTTEGFRGAYLHDPIAVAEAICPGILTSRASSVQIDTGAGMTRGMTTLALARRRRGSVRVAVAVDAGAFRKLLKRMWQ